MSEMGMKPEGGPPVLEPAEEAMVAVLGLGVSCQVLGLGVTLSSLTGDRHFKFSRPSGGPIAWWQG